jgi:hypothetical protein
VTNSAEVSEEPQAAGDTGGTLTYPTKYPWHVRLIIIASVFFIVVRSAFNIQMHKLHWADELGMFTLPYALPTEQERAEIRAGKSKRYEDVSSRLGAVATSLVRFANPVPTEKTLSKATGAVDWLKYGVVWVHSRIEFLGRLIGVDERWTMYSPTVGKTRTVARAVMWYSDGSTMEARAKTEPRDLASFVRPFSQRRLQFDVNLPSMSSARLGWSRYLARHWPENESGARLQKIDFYKVAYKLPDVGQDYAKHWRSGNARKVKGEPFWRYVVATDNGVNLEKKNDKAKSKLPPKSGGNVDLKTGVGQTQSLPAAEMEQLEPAVGATPGEPEDTDPGAGGGYTPQVEGDENESEGGGEL